jgi:hypothetical protein
MYLLSLPIRIPALVRIFRNGKFLPLLHVGRFVDVQNLSFGGRLRWSPKTGQVLKRESPLGAVGWPGVRDGEYAEETWL